MSNIENAMKKLEELRRAQETQDALSKDLAPGVPAEQVAYVVAPPDAAKVDERIVSFHEPNSLLTESFKQFHSVIRNLAQQSSATLAFASALHGEGRTTAAVNFAVALASDIQGTVCLVDADLRRPGVHKSLDVRVSRGLADVLALDVPLSDVIVPTSVQRLSVVCAGNSSANPSELLRSAKFARIVAELRERFDYTIFDTTPVLPVADTIHLASQVDGIIMVIEAGKTKRASVKRAIELLSHGAVMGFVLNKGSAEQG